MMGKKKEESGVFLRFIRLNFFSTLEQQQNLVSGSGQVIHSSATLQQQSRGSESGQNVQQGPLETFQDEQRPTDADENSHQGSVMIVDDVKPAGLSSTFPEESSIDSVPEQSEAK